MKKKIIRDLDSISLELVDISKRIFDYAELSFEEYRSADLLVKYLESKGFEIKRPAIKTLPTSFIASAGCGQPKISLMAEYDALPSIGHACGHNIICSSSIGAAVAVKESGFLETVEGSIFVIGCPAEESGGAKRDLVREGIFSNMDLGLIIHPASMSTGYDIAYALKRFKVEYHGLSAHAAADPSKGVNALDAVIHMFNGISALRQQLPEKVRVHGIISNGGQSFNTIPNYSSAEIGIRALTMAEVDNVVEKFERIVQAGSIATGCTYEITQTEQMEDVLVNVPLANLLDRNFELLGEKTTMRRYEQGVGSTDVGSVSHAIPAIQGYIDITQGRDIPTHTEEFAQASNSEFGYQAMIRAAKALALTVYDLLTEKRLVQEVKDYFAQGRRDF
ncbi:M20 family metallopeptidase [Mesotoga prima]|jgi:amidohydrolase|uniref:M20 family metallopeptidase n=1 Tax=Mesotoga prima TaxID=1184387 RepID=UPI002FDFE791